MPADPPILGMTMGPSARAAYHAAVARERAALARAEKAEARAREAEADRDAWKARATHHDPADAEARDIIRRAAERVRTLDESAALRAALDRLLQRYAAETGRSMAEARRIMAECQREADAGAGRAGGR